MPAEAETCERWQTWEATTTTPDSMRAAPAAAARVVPSTIPWTATVVPETMRTTLMAVMEAPCSSAAGQIGSRQGRRF